MDHMIAFYKKLADSVDKERTKDAVRSNLVRFSKAHCLSFTS